MICSYSILGNHRAQVFDPSGAFLFKIGGAKGKEDGQFDNPYGVGIDNSGQYLHLPLRLTTSRQLCGL